MGEGWVVGGRRVGFKRAEGEGVVERRWVGGGWVVGVESGWRVSKAREVSG